MSHMRRIGIRELRQNASEYVRAAESGETIEVTDRGRPVARLAPLPKGESILDRLIAEGKATPAQGDLLDLGPPPPPRPGARPLSEVLDEMREDRI
jgi:prevent-host-death family protein